MVNFKIKFILTYKLTQASDQILTETNMRIYRALMQDLKHGNIMYFTASMTMLKSHTMYFLNLLC
jgi:hypothetical protein